MSEVISASLIEKLTASEAAKVYLTPSGRFSPNSDAAIRSEVAEVANEYFNNPDRLYGDSAPYQGHAKEKPIHRAWVYAHACGATAREIAEDSGFSYHTVVQVLRQPWARQRLVQILNETGKDKIQHFLKNEVSPSLEVLREIRDDTAAKKSERITAANSILDRALGKPTVHVETDNTNRSVPTDMAKIDSELAALRKQVDGPTS